jgi:hypothetical protein
MLQPTLLEQLMTRLAEIVMRARGAGLAGKAQAGDRCEAAGMTLIPNVDRRDVAGRHLQTSQLDM